MFISLYSAPAGAVYRAADMCLRLPRGTLPRARYFFFMRGGVAAKSFAVGAKASSLLIDNMATFKKKCCALTNTVHPSHDDSASIFVKSGNGRGLRKNGFILLFSVGLPIGMAS